jgi:phosphatidylglycerophosphate synthase
VGPLIGFVGLVALLGGIDAGLGIGATAWVVGIGCGAGVCLLLGAALDRRPASVFGPANRITLLRAVLACGVAALAVEAAVEADRSGPVATMVVLATAALVLDGVDGRVARRTGTVSPLGARFDLEVDAFLILVLSGYVAQEVGWWVLLIGAARYLFVAAGRALPWLRGTVPPRPWCKVVAVVQGVVLTVAAADVLSPAWARLALGVALALLAESFGREVRDLWRARGRTGVRAVLPRLGGLVDRA